MAYKKKGKVAIEISIIYHWSIGAFFLGNFVVTVLSSVEHAVTEACDLKNNSCLQYNRSPRETIDRGALSSGLYTYGTLLSTKFFADVFNVIMFRGIRMWRIYSWLPDFPEILHAGLQPILNRKCPCYN